MSKRFRKLSNSPLRAIVSDVLPYELPLPFSTRDLHVFLRSLDFEWMDDSKFKVNAKIDAGSEEQLKILFGIETDKPLKWETEEDDSSFKFFELGKNGRKAIFAPRPHRFEVTTGSGKHRALSLLHPRSMIELAGFMHDYSDSILYYCNRSSYSLRHPYSIAKTTVRKDSLFKALEADAEFDIEMHNLEYESISSHFRYSRYNNINRFYDSSEFRACERKYPNLLRADVSKCFDSIYTHTISWVVNGVAASKSNKNVSSHSFGDKFDKCFQRINYNETSGICIGPEASRVFAEVILQEVDVLVARSISEELENLVFGTDFEIFRYVDDYFIFASNEEECDRILGFIKKHLAEYKLHINDAKTEHFQTPLASGISVAKSLASESLAGLSKREFSEDDILDFDLFLSAGSAIKAYKRILLETGEDHRNLSSYYLNRVLREVRKSIKRIVKHKALLDEQENEAASVDLAKQTAKYLIANIDLAFFVYAGSPSPTQSLKLCELIVLSVEMMEILNATIVEISSFKDKVRREITSQLNAVRDIRSFGIHTINLIDCLTHLDIGLDSEEIEQILRKRGLSIEKLDVVPILVLIRACKGFDKQNEVRKRLILRAGSIVQNSGPTSTEATILKLSIPHCSKLAPDEVKSATGLSIGKIRKIRKSKTASLFSWDMHDNYYQRLVLKSTQMVY